MPYFAELDAQTSNPSKQLLLIHPAVALTEGHRYAVALRHLFDGNGERIAPLATTKAALAGTLKPAERGAHIKWVIRHDLASVLGSTVPFQAWDFTVASAKSLAGPALTMHKLAYQWLDTHHVANRTRGAPTDFAPSFTVTSVTDSGGVRDVHGTFQVPLFLADTTPFSGLVTDSAGNPKINGADVDRRTSSASCLRRCRATGRRLRRSTGTASSVTPARSREVRSRPVSRTT